MRREGTVTVLRAGVIDDGIVTLRRLVVAGGGTAGDGRLCYAALSGSCALGFVSSSLRPTSRSDRPTSTAAPSRTNPATAGTEMATPASRETRRTPSRPTSLTVIAASVHCLGARATYHEGQSPGTEGPLRARRVGLSDQEEARDRAGAGRERSGTEAAGP